MEFENVDNIIFELSFSEAVKDMCLQEDEEFLHFIDDNNTTEELLNEKFYRRLVPYLEYNLLLFTGYYTNIDILSETAVDEKVKNYMVLSKQKIGPKKILPTAQQGIKNAALVAKSNLGKAIGSGITITKKKVGGEIVKRLNYASQNIANYAKKLQKKID
jgi:hypothetical protein